MELLQNKRKTNLFSDGSQLPMLPKRTRTNEDEEKDDSNENDGSPFFETILERKIENMKVSTDKDDDDNKEEEKEEEEDLGEEDDDGDDMNMFYDNDKEKEEDIVNMKKRKDNSTNAAQKLSSAPTANENEKRLIVDSETKEKIDTESRFTIGSTFFAPLSLETVPEDVLKLVVAQLPVADVMKNLAPVCRALRTGAGSLQNLIHSVITSVRIDAAYGRRIPKYPRVNYEFDDESNHNSLSDGAHLYHPFASWEQQTAAKVAGRGLVVRMKRRPLPLTLSASNENKDKQEKKGEKEEKRGTCSDDKEYYEEPLPKTKAELKRIAPLAVLEGSTDVPAASVLPEKAALAEEEKEEEDGSEKTDAAAKIAAAAKAKAAARLAAVTLSPAALASMMENGEGGNQRPVATVSPVFQADPYAWSVLDDKGERMVSAHHYDMTLDNLRALNNFAHRFRMVRQLVLVNTAVHFLSPPFTEQAEHLSAPLASIWPRLEELHLIGAVLPPQEKKSARSTLQQLNSMLYLRRLSTTSLRLCDLVEGCSPLLLSRLEELNCRLTERCQVVSTLQSMTTTCLGPRLSSLGFLVAGGECIQLNELATIQPAHLRELVHRIAFRYTISAPYLRQCVVAQFSNLTLLDFAIGLADNDYAEFFDDFSAQGDDLSSLKGVLSLLADGLPRLEELVFAFYRRGQALAISDVEFRCLASGKLYHETGPSRHEDDLIKPVRLPSVKRVRAAFRARLHTAQLLTLVFPAAERIDFVIEWCQLIKKSSRTELKCKVVPLTADASNKCEICSRFNALAKACIKAEARSVLLPIKQLPNNSNKEKYGQINFYHQYDW